MPPQESRGAHAVLGDFDDTVIADPGRLRAVHATGLLDRPNPELDRVAMLAATALGVPYAAVTLVDRDSQLMVGYHPGGPTGDRPVHLAASLSRFTVATGKPFIVEDTRRHPQVADSPLARSGDMLAYAGIPLADHRHRIVGAMAAWDQQARRWTTGQLRILTDFSAIVAARIFGRRS